MKKLIAIFLFSILLTSCGKAPDTAVVKVEKKPFLIDTQLIGKKTEVYTIEKSARLTAGSSLTLSAESVGEVSSISVKEGSKIRRGTRLISLRDTVNSYDIRVAQAANSVSIQDASIESTKIGLDRAITDSQIAYEQAKRAYDTLSDKNSIIYDTLVTTNKRTLDSYNENYKTYLNDIDSLMTNFLYEGDKILGMTSTFQYSVDGWKPYLGARIGNVRVDSENLWNKVYTTRGELRAKKEKSITLSSLNLTSDLAILVKSYGDTRLYIDAMILMMQNNAIGGGLSQELQNGWIAQWNGIKSQITPSEAGFNGWKSQTITFFNTYQNNEIATKLAVATLTRKLTPEEQSLLDSNPDISLVYKNTSIDLRDRIAGAKLALRQAQSARDAALKSRGATLTQLGASRQSGVLSLEQAQREYSKLAIGAPFDGTVTKVIATQGQRVNPGTPMIEIVSNTPEVVIDLDAEIANTLSVGDTVSVNIGEKKYSGSIIALARSAGANLLYTTRISVPEATSVIGNAASIVFAGSRDVSSDVGAEESITLSLKAVKIISEQEGEITFLEGSGTLIHKSVRLGRIIGDRVSIETPLTSGAEVVLSDVSNFDKEKFFLQKRKK